MRPPRSRPDRPVKHDRRQGSGFRQSSTVTSWLHTIFRVGAITMLGVEAILLATALAAGALRLLGRDGAQRLAEPGPRRGQNQRQPRRDRAASRGPIKSTLLEDSH